MRKKVPWYETVAALEGAISVLKEQAYDYEYIVDEVLQDLWATPLIPKEAKREFNTFRMQLQNDKGSDESAHEAIDYGTHSSGVVKMLEVVVNGETVLSFDRNSRAPGHQRQFLETMDLDMDEGIEMAGEQIASPDDMQRAKYVSMSLIVALQGNNKEMAMTMCAYLAKRIPDLKQVRAIENGDDVDMDLLFTEPN